MEAQRFYATSKCGVLVVGQRTRGKFWHIGKGGMTEEDKYGVWITTRQIHGYTCRS